MNYLVFISVIVTDAPAMKLFTQSPESMSQSSRTGTALALASFAASDGAEAWGLGVRLGTESGFHNVFAYLAFSGVEFP
jgi:hypothetical protein